MSKWDESLNSKQRRFHPFKRSSREFHVCGETVLGGDQDESHPMSHPLFQVLQLAEEGTNWRERKKSWTLATGHLALWIYQERKVLEQRYGTRSPSRMLIKCLLAASREPWASSRSATLLAAIALHAASYLHLLWTLSLETTLLLLRFATVHSLPDISHVKMCFRGIVCWKNEVFRGT